MLKKKKMNPTKLAYINHNIHSNSFINHTINTLANYYTLYKNYIFKVHKKTC